MTKHIIYAWYTSDYTQTRYVRQKLQDIPRPAPSLAKTWNILQVLLKSVSLSRLAHVAIHDNSLTIHEPSMTVYI